MVKRQISAGGESRNNFPSSNRISTLDDRDSLPLPSLDQLLDENYLDERPLDEPIEGADAGRPTLVEDENHGAARLLQETDIPYEPSQQAIWDAEFPQFGTVSEMVPVHASQAAEPVLGTKRKLQESFKASPFFLARSRPFKSRPFSGGVVDDFQLEVPENLEPEIDRFDLRKQMHSFYEAFTTRQSRQVTFKPLITINTRRGDQYQHLVLAFGFRIKLLGGSFRVWDAINARTVTSGAVNYEGEIEGEGHRDFEPEVRLDESADHIIVEEVYVIAKDPEKRTPDQSWRTEGSFSGTGSINMPFHPGTIWHFDICCRISGVDNECIWMKALNKLIFNAPSPSKGDS